MALGSKPAKSMNSPQTIRSRMQEGTGGDDIWLAICCAGTEVDINSWFAVGYSSACPSGDDIDSAGIKP